LLFTCLEVAWPDTVDTDPNVEHAEFLQWRSLPRPRQQCSDRVSEIREEE